VSIEQRLEFDRPELAALADKAVFVVCYYDSTTGRMEEEYAERMRAHLKITTFPAISTINNRTDVLTEVGRFEGLFGAAELAKGLEHDLQLPMTTGAEREQSEAARRAFVKPQSPEEAIKCYSEAVRAGDTYAISRLFASPYGVQYGSMANVAEELFAAKQRLRSALNDQFGIGEDSLNIGRDLEMMRQELRNVTIFEIVRVVNADLDHAVVEVRVVLADEEPCSAHYELAREEGVWRVLPYNYRDADFTALYESRANEAKFQAMQLDLITDQVRRGEFANREQAVQAAFTACNAASEEAGGQLAG
jgi:hypothetical protein